MKNVLFDLYVYNDFTNINNTAYLGEFYDLVFEDTTNTHDIAKFFAESLKEEDVIVLKNVNKEVFILKVNKDYVFRILNVRQDREK